MRTTKHVLCLLILAMSASLLRADSLTLRSGRNLHGRYVGGTAGVIAFASNGATQYFSVRDVLSLVFSDEDDQAANFVPQNFDQGTTTERRANPQVQERQDVKSATKNDTRRN